MNLCPGCGIREQELTSGLCSDCEVEHAVTSYVLSEQDAIAERREQWFERTKPSWEHARVTRERQRRHRLIEAVTPQIRPSPNEDPYELAADAIRHLKFVEKSIRMTASIDVLYSYSVAVERIKQLAVGPHPYPRVEDPPTELPLTETPPPKPPLYLVPRRYRPLPGQLRLWEDDATVGVVAA